MQAKELISDIIPFLRTSDSGEKALSWMEIFRISHLPIVKDFELLGIITDTDIYDLNSAQETVWKHDLSLVKPYVFEDQHIYEIINIVSNLKLTLIPVLSLEKKYLGSISMFSLLHEFGRMTAAEKQGGIVVLKMLPHDYSLADLARLVESNDAKILSSFIKSDPNKVMIEVTLKLNKLDISSVLRTFDRYGYIVESTYSDDSKLDAVLDDRYEMFLNYLDM